jgi:hypothetical protein
MYYLKSVTSIIKVFISCGLKHTLFFLLPVIVGCVVTQFRIDEVLYDKVIIAVLGESY